MARRRLGLLGPISAADEKDLMYKQYHQAWRKTNTDSNASFIPLFTSFKAKHLASLDSGPLRLYLFFAFAAKNQYGHSWHSIQSIAEFFGTQTRTVDNWIKVLVDKNLIYREQKGKKSHTTYLIPYSDILLRHQVSVEDDQLALDLLIGKIEEREFLYGPVIDVLHFFQWGTEKKDKTTKNRNIQWFVVITKREDEVLTGHYTLIKDSDNNGIDELEIEDLATFSSPFKHNGNSIQGVGITHSVKLTDSNTDEIMSLITRIVNEELWDWKEYPSVSYGKITDFFSDEEIEKENEKENEEV
jgi:hypothetical protein